MRRKLLAALGTVVAVAIAILLWSSSTSRPSGLSAPRYTGDGRFVDQGPRAAIRRYVVDLGTIDLTRAGSRELSMSGLPPETYVLGLQVRARAEPGRALYDARPVRATLRLEVFDARNEVLVSEESPLDAWTWSGQVGVLDDSFVYMRGDEQPHPAGARAVDSRGAGAACGSCFEARPGGKYRARFTVVGPDPGAAGYVATARAFAGGWKVTQSRGRD